MSSSSPNQQTIICPANLISWDEDRSITTTPRVGPATVKFSLSTITGTLTSSYLMTYLSGGSGNASFIFTDVIETTDFKGKKGSFITQGKGLFDASTYKVKGEFEIVSGGGTGDLESLEGKGGFASKEGENGSNVEYFFEVKL